VGLDAAYAACVDIPSRLDYFNIGAQYVVQRAQKIDAGMPYVQGSDANILCGVGAVLADAVTKQLLYNCSRLFLDGCFDEDLDRYIWDRYQLTRKGASAATTLARLYRPSAAAGAGVVPSNTSVLSLTGIEYITTQPGNFGASTVDNVIVPVRAVQAGKATQVGANQLRRFKSPTTLFDSTLLCNNDSTSAGGEDREDDDTVKARVRNFWNTARRGTLSAIEFGARTVPGVVSAEASEALNPFGQPARIVNLYISDSSGVASVPLAQQVAVALQEYRAGGITVLITTSIPFLQAVVLKLVFATGVDTVTLSGQVQAAVVEFINSLPVNGELYLADLYTVLRRFVSQGLVQAQASIVSPVTDVVPSVGQTIRTTTNLVTLT
jgi:Baseplate J-like protein